MKRRHFLQLGGAGISAAALPLRAQQLMPMQDLQPLIRGVAGDVPPKPGRVHIGLPQLAENGNSVPLELTVDSPMTAADHVVALALFNERNPQRDVFTARLGPRSGRARVSSRIRLATTQKLVAVARMRDGSCWSRTVDVIVTLAACIEGET